MTVFEMAQKYYPRLWSLERIDALYEAGKLKKEEYLSLTGEENDDI